MTIFQLVLIVAVLAGALLAIRSLRGEKSLALKRLLALVAAVGGILAILFPNALTAIAHFLGIGRGTDLLLYVFIIVAMIAGVSVLRAKARSDARVSELARAVALMDARLSERADPSHVDPPSINEASTGTSATDVSVRRTTQMDDDRS